MAITCYLAADMNTLTTKLADLADVAGTFNLGGVKTKLRGIDAGSFSPEMGLFAPDTGDGSFRTRRRNPSVGMTLQLRTQATSQDNHRLFLDYLFSLLEYPRVLVYKGEGMVGNKYIKTLGATSVDQLLRGGQDNYDQVVRLFQDADLLLTLERQPIILTDELLSSLNPLTNALLFYDQDGTNGATTGRPDGWTWRTTAGVADAVPISAESCGGQTDGYLFTLAAGATRDLTQDQVAGAAVGDVFAGQFVFEAAAGITATAGIQFLTAVAGALVGAASLGAAVVGNGAEQRPTVVSAAAGATTAAARALLRVTNTSGGALTVKLRRAMIEESASVSRFRAGNETVPNDLATTRGRMLGFWNDGQAPVPVVVASAMDAGSNVSQMILGKRGNNGVQGARSLGDLNVARYVQAENTERGWTVTLGTDTTQPVAADDADASGDGGGAGTNYITITHASQPATSKQRLRVTRTTLLDCLRGRMNVYGRFRMPATARQFAVRLKWSPSLTVPTLNSEEEVLLDSVTQTTAFVGGGGSVAVTSGFIDLFVGSFELPVDSSIALAGLTLEIWSRCTKPDQDAGGADATIAAADLQLDHLWLVPSDVSLEDGIGAVFIQGSGPEKVIGKTLQTPPATTTQAPADPAWVAGAKPSGASSVLRLNDDHEACGWGPNAGTLLGTGRHRFTFNIAKDTLSNGGAGTRNVLVRVLDTFLAGNPRVVGCDNRYSKKLPSTIVLEFDGIAAHTYQAQVCIENYGSAMAGNSGVLDVASIQYESVPFLASTEKFRSDPGDRFVAEKVDTTDSILTTARASGELPFFADRGMSVLSIRHDEIPLQNYLDRQNKKARVPTVTFRYRPGFYEL